MCNVLNIQCGTPLNKLQLEWMLTIYAHVNPRFSSTEIVLETKILMESQTTQLLLAVSTWKCSFTCSLHLAISRHKVPINHLTVITGSVPLKILSLLECNTEVMKKYMVLSQSYYPRRTEHDTTVSIVMQPYLMQNIWSIFSMWKINLQ